MSANLKVQLTNQTKYKPKTILIIMKKDNNLSRRNFLKSSALAGAAGVIGTGTTGFLTSCSGGNSSKGGNAPLKQPGSYYIPNLVDIADDGKELKAGVVGCGGRGSGAAKIGRASCRERV